MRHAPKKRIYRKSTRLPCKHATVLPRGFADLTTNQLRAIHAAFKRAGVFKQLDEWRYGHERLTVPVGKPEAIPLAAYITVTAALIENHDAPLISEVAHAMRYRLTRQAAQDLKIPEENYRLKDAAPGQTWWNVKDTDDEDTVIFVIAPMTFYDRVHSVFSRLATLVEPYPGIATKEARPYGKVLEALAELNAEDIAEKERRLQWLMDAILKASLYRFPRRHRRALMKGWGGSIAIDGTKVPLFAHGGGVPVDQREAHPEWLHHGEAMAGYHVRTGNHAGMEDDGSSPLPRPALRSREWAYELHLAVAVACERSSPHFPRIALGAAFDAPAGRIGENSFATLLGATAACADFGITPGTIVADRAILPNSKFEKFQQPARERGWKLCMDYRKDQLGKKDAPQGTIQVEGDFYCPGMPSALIDASKLFQGNLSEEEQATYDARIAQRGRYVLTRKEPINAQGRGRFECPATTPGGHLACPLQPLLTDKTRTAVKNPPKEPGAICRKPTVSVTLADEAKPAKKAPRGKAAGKRGNTTGKYAQDYRYKTKRWQKMWGERNTVEGFNAALKDEQHEAMGQAGRRRVRGKAKQAILVTLMVYSVNVRRIRDHIHTYESPPPSNPTSPGPSTANTPTGALTTPAISGMPPPLPDDT